MGVPTLDELAADALRFYGNHREAGEPSVFLTGRARSREFKYRSMDNSTRNEFHKAMSSEWQSFQNFDALRPLTKEEKDYVKENGIAPVKMRWVLTDKNDRLRAAKPNLPLHARRSR